MLALDFVSLLLTKEDPNKSMSTLSPTLKSLVGIGTLGADKLAASNIDEKRLKDNKIVSTGWRFTDINKTADSLLSSASRLQKEIGLETKYWAEVLAVSDKGWSVTRVPRERHTLGVRYGFSEAAPDFKNTSLAPMRRSEDGTVDLDCGRIIGESQRLLVEIEKDGNIVGSSTLPKSLSANAPLEDRVLEARNTIFAQELWHEINREGRLLLSHGVQLEDSAVSYNYGDNSRIIFSLQALEEFNQEDTTQKNSSESTRAESLSAVLHLLLTYAHRVNNQRRSQPSMASRNQSTPQQPYFLIRPIIAHLLHEGALEKATRFVSGLTSMLQSAGITTAMFKLTEPPVSPQLTSNTTAARSSPSEALISPLLGLSAPLQFQFELTVNPETRLLVRGRTISLFATTTYEVLLLPPLPGARVQYNPLQETYPPTESHQGYPELTKVMHYLRQAIVRVLVDGVAPNVTNDDEDSAWSKDISGTLLEKAGNQGEKLSFEIVHSGGVDEAGGHGADELRLVGDWVENRKLHHKEWTWTAYDAVKGLQKENLEQVVRGFLGGLTNS